jgi:hypothetical protein
MTKKDSVGDQPLSVLVRPRDVQPKRPENLTLTEFFRGRPVMSSRGINVYRALRSVGIAFVAAATVTISACGEPASEDSLGYDRPIPTTTEVGPSLQGVAAAPGRFERWDDYRGSPQALYLRGAVGGDGYELNWVVPDLDAPLPVPPGLEFGAVPPGTRLSEDPYGVRSPSDPAVRERYSVKRIEVDREPMADNTICVQVNLQGKNDKALGSQAYVIHPERSKGSRVQYALAGRPCPGERPAESFDVPIEVLGQGR